LDVVGRVLPAIRAQPARDGVDVDTDTDLNVLGTQWKSRLGTMQPTTQFGRSTISLIRSSAIVPSSA
ncbi:MAG: hypothetical protein JWR46_701, partial [Mycobacterium sp.]|nr:hypothetical protein [Mycobacterium sp.]